MKVVFKIWMTGMLLFLFILGHLFYGILWVVRLMRNKAFKPLLLLFQLSLLASAGLIFYLFLPVSFDRQPLEIVISKGASLRAVADTLESKQIITSSKALRFWLKITGAEKKIQAGKFLFSRGEGALSASKKLQKALSVEKAIIIHEGLTVEQIAKRFSDDFGVCSTEFVRLCNDEEFIANTGIEEKSLEGYLFPDTYRFPEDVTSEAIISKMVSRFLEMYKSVEGDPRIISKYSRHQLLTLASIVEKEATLASERGRIAGVFHNRLRLGYPLGADPTVRYIFRKFDGPLRMSELNVDNPYNTRRFTGIPPGPICSPGLAAIQAAASPDSTDDLYFVAKWDGTGAHDFSRTYEEHNRKKLQIRRQNEMRKDRKGE